MKRKWGRRWGPQYIWEETTDVEAKNCCKTANIRWKKGAQNKNALLELCQQINTLTIAGNHNPFFLFNYLLNCSQQTTIFLEGNIYIFLNGPVPL